MAILASKADIPGEKLSEAEVLAGVGLAAGESVRVFTGVSGASGAGVDEAVGWLCDAM